MTGPIIRQARTSVRGSMNMESHLSIHSQQLHLPSHYENSLGSNGTYPTFYENTNLFMNTHFYENTNLQEGKRGIYL